MAKAPTQAPAGSVPVDAANVEFWEALRTPDPMFTKKFDRGSFKGTATSPIYIARRMTELFGPVGIGWGWDIDQIIMLPNADHPEVVHVQVTVWYQHPNPPAVNNRDETPPLIGRITHVGGNQLFKFRKDKGSNKAEPAGWDDEAIKAAITDAIGKALTYLGMSADIHMGLFDDNKYLRDAQAVFDRTDPVAPSRVAAEQANDLADQRSEGQKPIAPPPPPAKTKAELDDEEQHAWAAKAQADIAACEESEAGWEDLARLQKELRPVMEKYGKENGYVKSVRSAWTERRRKIEQVIGFGG